MQEISKNLLLSIIIPVLITENNNMEKYLQRCIDSLKNNIDIDKFINNFEVIVVDDYSYDQNLVDKIDFGEINYQIIKNKENKGIGGARNIGLDNSKGKWIWYFDGDDFFENTCLTRLFTNVFKLNDTCKLCYIPFNSIKDVNGGQVKPVGQVNVDQIGFNNLPNYAAGPVSSCCKLIRKDIAVRHSEKVYMEDVVFHFKQLDKIDNANEVACFTDGSYWTYDLRRPTNFTKTSMWLQVNKLTIEQHIRNIDNFEKQGLKRKAISDVFRLVAELFDLIPTLSHDIVKQMAAARLINITDKIKCCNYTH